MIHLKCISIMIFFINVSGISIMILFRKSISISIMILFNSIIPNTGKMLDRQNEDALTSSLTDLPEHVNVLFLHTIDKL